MSVPASHALNDQRICDRHLAATQPISPGWTPPHEHSDEALPIYALAVILIGGGFIQHFGSGLPLPYTVLLLMYGAALACWLMFDPSFTLQPGMRAGEHAWPRGGMTDAVLQCNVTAYVPNDLHNRGSHLGNSLRGLGSIDPHLLLHVMLPPLLFESAFAIDWHIFSKVSIYAIFLALPGLIVCTVLTGLTYQVLLPLPM